GRSAERARCMFLALSIAGFLYAGYGFLVEVSGVKLVLWYPKIWYPDSLTATFVNRNNYATYAGLGLIVASGLVIRHVSTLISLPLEGRARLLARAVALSRRLDGAGDSAGAQQFPRRRGERTFSSGCARRGGERNAHAASPPRVGNGRRDRRRRHPL